MHIKTQNKQNYMHDLPFLRLNLLFFADLQPIFPKIRLQKDKIDVKTLKFGLVVHIKIKNRLNYMHFHAKMIMKFFF